MKKTLVTLCLGLSIFPAHNIYAQENSEQDDRKKQADNRLEEVVVTARRRSENLQETPISVSAFSGDALEEVGISDVSNLGNVMPNVQMSSTASKAPALYVRGIGQRQTDAVLDPGVGQYLNGVYIARQDARVMDAVDIESIQILRGPQGTLFGKNNTGGAMLITTKRPHYEGYSATLGATLGDYGRENLKLGVNIPVFNDRFALRLNAQSTKLDGYEKNIADGKYFRDENRQSIAARQPVILHDPFR